MTATRRTPQSQHNRAGVPSTGRVPSMGPPDSIAPLATRAQRRLAWSETNGSWERHGSFVALAIALATWPPVTDNHNVFVHNS